jgi:alcohol dehydrogenase (cytochrome c)
MQASAYGYEPLEDVNVTRGRGEFVALDAKTGVRVWRRLLPQPDFGCATVAKGVVFTSTFDGTIYAFDTRNGATLWQTQMTAGINACPALAGNMLLVGAGSPRTKHGALELDAWSTQGS